MSTTERSPLYSLRHLGAEAGVFLALSLTPHLPDWQLADTIPPLLYSPLAHLDRIRKFDRERAALRFFPGRRRAEKDAPLPGCSSPLLRRRCRGAPTYIAHWHSR